MNAIDLLKADHERVKGILAQLSESTERGVKKRTELLAKLEMEIKIHTRLEEEVLYPAYKKNHGSLYRRVFRSSESGQGTAGTSH